MAFDPNLRARVMSALVLAPVTLLAVYFGGWVFAAVVTLTALLGLREWLRLTKPDLKLMAVGIPYLGGFALAMLYLRLWSAPGMALVYYLLAVVWGTDIGAYLSGKLIGGPKLAPAISPKKTWAGLFGGMALAGLLGYAVACGFQAGQPAAAFGLGIILAAVAQSGDFFKSYFKRRAGVKESGGLIPGHGGVLDRIDGLIFAAIVLALIQFAAGQWNWW